MKKIRNITLTLNECSEIRIVLDKRIESIKRKLDTLSKVCSSSDSLDEELLSYWQNSLDTLRIIYEKLCSPNILESDYEN